MIKRGQHQEACLQDMNFKLKDRDISAFLSTKAAAKRNHSIENTDGR